MHGHKGFSHIHIVFFFNMFDPSSIYSSMTYYKCTFSHTHTHLVQQWSNFWQHCTKSPGDHIHESVVWVTSLQDICFLGWTSKTIGSFGVNYRVARVLTHGYLLTHILQRVFSFFFWGGKVWVAECWPDVGLSMAQSLFDQRDKFISWLTPELFAAWMPIGGFEDWRVCGSFRKPAGSHAIFTPKSNTVFSASLCRDGFFCDSVAVWLFVTTVNTDYSQFLVLDGLICQWYYRMIWWYQTAAMRRMVRGCIFWCYTVVKVVHAGLI